MKNSRSCEPHLNIFHQIVQGRAIGATKDEYVLYITVAAWRDLGEPGYVKLSVKTRSQSIRVLPVDGERGGARRVTLVGKSSCKVGKVNRLVDAGMRIGRYLYEGNNIFVHE